MKMEEITLEIDGKGVSGNSGDTILEVCQRNNIYVPTLCHLEGLSSYGGCRLCLVDVEGQRGLVPACTTPAADGMKVRTRGEKLAEYRRTILELMLSERNHFCFICEKSGECELQSLCYEFGIDHSSFPGMYPSLLVDSSAGMMAIDNNRCILCGRCVRMCSEIVGNNTLGFVNRGAETVINEPDTLSLEESNCLKCGACIEVCPTGAIFATLTSYLGREDDCEIRRTVCQECPMACDLKVYVRDENLVRVCGEGLSGRYGGQLCSRGRFGLLSEGKGPSEIVPEGSLDKSIERAAAGLAEVQSKYGRESVCAIVSPRCTNEALRSFRELVDSVGIERSYLLEPSPSLISWSVSRCECEGDLAERCECETPELLKADTILAIGFGSGDPHHIIASNIRRALNGGASLVSIGRLEHVLTERADLDIRLLEGELGALIASLGPLVKISRAHRDDEMEEAVAGAARSSGLDAEDISSLMTYLDPDSRVIMVIGQEIECNEDLVKSVVDFGNSIGRCAKGRLPLLCIRCGGNVTGALEILGGTGIRSIEDFPRDGSVKGILALVADEDPRSLARLEVDPEFLVVQSAYGSSLSERADVVLPSRAWSERSGTYTDIDGHSRVISPVIKTERDVPSDERVIERLGRAWREVKVESSVRGEEA